MKTVDESENQRFDARNTLEEVIFETRDNISNGDSNKLNVNADSFQKLLDSVEDWLYNSGDNCKRKTYLLLRREIVDFNMIGKVKRIDEQTEDDFNMLRAKIFSIMQL